MWLGLAIDPLIFAKEIGYYPEEYCNLSGIEYRIIDFQYHAYLIMPRNNQEVGTVLEYQGSCQKKAFRIKHLEKEKVL